MKKLITFGILISVFTSCGTATKPKIVHVENNESEITALKRDSTFVAIADLPIQIDSTEYFIHPIGDFKIEKYSGKSIYKSSSYRSQNFTISNYNGYQIVGNISNVKFQHINSEELTPLTDKVIKIKSISFLRKIFDNTKKQFLVYEINDKDSNQDGKINANDIKTLYLSNINGANFNKLTKTNRELINWSILESKNRLYFRTIEDINKDGVFDKKDIIHYNFVNLKADKLKITEYNPI